ncbi:serine hydrolase [Steroidobacter flavus]|uniref:Serine hydrolase n=1 Tax=Steroidobacter flavus TaxID=1842136 RepID=A0ABV8SZL5_9GAMM
MEMRVQHVDRLDGLIAGILKSAQVPGAAIAIVAEGRTAFARGYGFRSLRPKQPMTADTVYPIASTTKPMNAMLLGMLVDEGKLAWDTPVQNYFPGFRLHDPIASSRATLRDLVTMRTGLPRHDWAWVDSGLSRAELVKRLAHLELSADFRERFQYSNLSVTAAGHIAEIVTGKRWEELIQQRILAPLGMHETTCHRPVRGKVTASYHENARRKLVSAWRYGSQATAPSGGAVHSTVTDMASWLLFHLAAGSDKKHRGLLKAETLRELHSPQVIVGKRALASLSPDATYALGWVVDYYRGHKRFGHTGYLHDVDSSTVFYPELGVGLVSFLNKGGSISAEVVNQCAFDTLMDVPCEQVIVERLAQYRTRLEKIRQRTAAVPRTAGTRPTHASGAYVGTYEHAGYGAIEIRQRGRKLILIRESLKLDLKHWHYDAWVPESSDVWSVHQVHPFDGASLVQFHVDARGAIGSLSFALDPEVAPIRFARRQV